MAKRQTTSKKTHRLGDLQLRILKVLWSAGPLAVAEVHKELGSGTFAYTTIATMLRKMEARKLVTHSSEGRRFIYEAAVTAETVTRSMTDDLVDRLFEGSLADTVNHLLDARNVSDKELDRLEELIKRRRGER